MAPEGYFLSALLVILLGIKADILVPTEPLSSGSVQVPINSSPIDVCICPALEDWRTFWLNLLGRPFFCCPIKLARGILDSAWERGPWSLRADLELVSLLCASIPSLQISGLRRVTEGSVAGPEVQDLLGIALVTSLQSPLLCWCLQTPPHPQTYFEIIMHSLKSFVLCLEFT